MRNAEDLEDFESYDYPDEPVRRCPECGDDDRHDRDCSRNYRNRTYGVTVKPDPRRENYWLGYRHGRRIAEHGILGEQSLWDNLKFAVTTDTQKTDRARAFALGELRGYRSAQP